VKSNILPKNSQPGLFFIIGRPRSGTTLLRSILDAHSRIIVPPEYPVLLNCLHLLHPQNLSSNKKKIKFYKSVISFKKTKRELFESIGLNEENLTDDLLKNSQAISFSDAFVKVQMHCKSCRLEKPALLVGDKNPVYSFIVMQLLKKFPEAKFVFLVRDPRDQFASLKKFDFEASSPVLQALRWQKLMLDYISIVKRFPERIHFVQYEHLVSKPDEEISKICKFLNLEPENEMLHFNECIKDSVQPNLKHMFAKYHSSLIKPLSSVNIEKWKSELSKNEIITIEHITGKSMSKLGYHKISKHTFSFRLLFLKCVWNCYSAILLCLMKMLLMLPMGVRYVPLVGLSKLSKIYNRLFAFSSAKK
jgi:hypothetical protein